jgi:hypothetical protein
LLTNSIFALYEKENKAAHYQKELKKGLYIIVTDNGSGIDSEIEA